MFGSVVLVTWLFQTTRHRAIDYLRARKRERELFDDEGTVDVSQRAGADDERLDLSGGSVTAALAQLAPAHREVLQLRYEEDLSYAEISAITQLSISHVGVLIHTALKTLRQRYASASRDFIAFNPHPTK